MSLSDGGAPMLTMPVQPTNSGGFGFGGDGAWWLIVLFLFAFCGWGGNSWGNNAGNSGGVVDGYVLTSDFANVERKIESVNQGLCDGFYQQAQLVNGTNMTMANGFAQAELSRSNQQAALMQQLNAMQMQAANCCCENRAAIAQVRYDMAAQACDTRNTVQNATRDIIDNAGYKGCFGHSLGHGVGLYIHESPRLAASSPREITLQPGHVVTVEPGIYIAGKYGCRIEDMITILPDGTVHDFTQSPKQLIEL